MKSLFASLLVFCLPVLAAPVPPAELPPCVVEVLVTSQQYDSHMPWSKTRPETRAGYAIVIADGRLITTEELVRNAVMVEILKPGSAIKTAAVVRQSDPRLNAALLSAPTTGYTPIAWGLPVRAGAKIQLIQFDDAGLQQNGEGRITGVEVASLPNGAHSILTYQVLTDLKLDRVGTPAIHDGRLAGLVMQYDGGSETSLVIPAALLKRFVEDCDRTPYPGVAVAGFGWAPLTDPVKRRYLGIPDDDRGIMVLKTIPGTGAATVFQAGDVIMKWDGYDIDSQGYYTDPEFGRLLMLHQISGRRHPGDVAEAVRRRGDKTETVQVKLDAYDDSRSLVSLNIEGVRAEYLIEGGMFLRELSADYLLAFGAQWMIRANPRLVNLYLTRAQAPTTPGDRVVILAGVLPDAINVGYQSVRDEVITKVNGKPVANMRDVFAARERDGRITRLTTQTFGVDLVLDKNTMDDANRRIAERYRIPRLQYRKAQPMVGPLRSLNPGKQQNTQ